MSNTSGLTPVEFCQMRPIPTALGYTMVRNIPTAIMKDSMSTNRLEGNAGKCWFYAVGECGLALSSGVPIMNSFYRMYKRNGKPSKILDSNSMDGAGATYLYSAVKTILAPRAPCLDEQEGRGGGVEGLNVSSAGAAAGADLGGSSKYSNENFED